jgi:RNA polymerase sigma-70 factor (ECF subfamily)
MIDPAELAAWFEAHAAGLGLYAQQWLNDRAAAEDVVQDVFLRLAAQRRPPPNVRAWLYASVRNAAVDAARSASRRKRREEAVGAAGPGWFEPAPGDAIDAAAVQRALAHLPPRQREVVTLRAWSGMTLAEVSQVTGMPVSSVHDEYRRGLDALRRVMEKPCTTTKTAATVTRGR